MADKPYEVCPGCGMQVLCHDVPLKKDVCYDCGFSRDHKESKEENEKKAKTWFDMLRGGWGV